MGIRRKSAHMGTFRAGLCVSLAALGLAVSLPDAAAQPTPTETQTSRAAQGWSVHNAGAQNAAQSGGPVVIEVFVPLCSENRGGPCGKHKGAGDPADLEANIYWGAIYGARRYFERGWLGWTRTEQTAGDGSFELERVTYKRSVSGSPWGTGQAVDVVVVMHGIHGDSNKEAMERFRDTAANGGSVKFNDGSGLRDERVHAVGFMGRNPLLKNGRPPAEDDLDLPEVSKSGNAIPSFSIAAHSRETLGTWLFKAGSPRLLLARGATASEGYLLESIAKSLAENQPGYALRKRATQTYAKHHKLPLSAAEVFFSPTIPRHILNSMRAAQGK